MVQAAIVENEDALIARVAICLLSIKFDDVQELGEHLSWFFEVLQHMEFKLDKPIELMEEYFEFEELR